MSEIIGNVHDLRARAGFFQSGANLQHAAGIGGNDQVRAGLENVFCFSPLQTFGHFGFGQIVGAGAAAANIRLGQVNKIFPGDSFDQIARLAGDALGVGEMTGVVVGDLATRRGQLGRRGKIRC